MDKIFFPRLKGEIEQFKKESLPDSDQEKVIFFWNNRNARRKTVWYFLIFWFKEWLDKNNLHDKAQLIMHTEPKRSSRSRFGAHC